MDYARFGFDSDVYVVHHVTGRLECKGCFLQPATWVKDESKPLGGSVQPVGELIQTTFDTPSEMLAHLGHHQALGHKVPQYAIERLQEEASELGSQPERSASNGP